MLRHTGIGYIAVIFLVTGMSSVCNSRAVHAQTPRTLLILQPIEIDIPSIRAHIPIIDVGVTASGALDVPHNFLQAGWYDDGPLPGQPGTAIIDGHVDNGGKHPTIAGVFKRLNSLSQGDLMSVTLSDGSTTLFKVISTAVYPYTSFPSQQVFAQTDEVLLNIITCDGTWVAPAKTYSDRLVVTAERIS